MSPAIGRTHLKTARCILRVRHLMWSVALTMNLEIGSLMCKLES